MLFDFLKPYMDARDNKRDIRKLEKKLEKINELEAELKQLSDEELKQKTTLLKEKIKQGKKTENILPEAYAIVREASDRVLGMRHFDVQLMGGIILHQGRIAEMKTGEGKTLVATLPVYLNALAGKGVHVITANDYLAKRDSEIMGKLYEFLGLSVGVIYPQMPKEERITAYQKDITYGTNSEFGFDYLRDHMVIEPEQKVQRELYFALIDEVDSILIDEARTPLIIAGEKNASMEFYKTAAEVIPKLKEQTDYEVDIKEKRVALTEVGVEKVEKFLSLDNFSNPENMEIAHHINNALRAYTLMKRDVDYVVKDDEIVIVDEFTGRLMHGRRYNDGLHQAIEAKEHLEVKKETQVMATITFQNYFRMYKKLSGMTGTAKTEEDEFRSIYGMDVVPIPTNKPILRKDLPDIVYRTEQGKFQAIADKVEKIYETGQPVLIGTVSIETSELLSREFIRRNLPHQVLNAKFHDLEANIISRAGEKHAITIATNMAGRGTDIKLGEGVHELGGLYIIGTERHESRRIDNQLRGRSGRQGDPGTTQFYLSLEDTLMRRFCAENMTGFLDKIGMDDTIPIENKMVTKTIESAQKRVESNNFDIRKHVLEYDDVMNKQRQVIYDEREKIISGNNLENNILHMAELVVEDIVAKLSAGEMYPEQWNINSLQNELSEIFLFDVTINKEKLPLMTKESLTHELKQKVKARYIHAKSELGAEPFSVMEKEILLKHVDLEWQEHLDDMEELKRGIGLRAYAQKKPVQEYQFEAYEMFQHLLWRIQMNTVREIYRSLKVLTEQMHAPKEIRMPAKKIVINLR